MRLWHKVLLDMETHRREVEVAVVVAEEEKEKEKGET